MSRNEKIALFVALDVFALLLFFELKPVSTTLHGVSAVPNELGVPTAAPNASLLTAQQTGTGLFGNPSGLGNNPISDVPAIVAAPAY